MLSTNKETIKHQDHAVEVRRANPKSPHYGYYHCVTCNKFISWIDKRTYQIEKVKQKRQNVMWFGKYQGVQIEDLPDGYLEWAIMNVTGSKSDMVRLDQEYLRRNNIKE
jgi:hypothetical protein